MHMSTVPLGINGVIEIPVTTVKPSQNGVFDLITMIHSIFHTDHSDIPEQIDIRFKI